MDGCLCCRCVRSRPDKILVLYSAHTRNRSFGARNLPDLVQTVRQGRKQGFACGIRSLCRRCRIPLRGQHRNFLFRACSRNHLCGGFGYKHICAQHIPPALLGHGKHRLGKRNNRLFHLFRRGSVKRGIQRCNKAFRLPSHVCFVGGYLRFVYIHSDCNQQRLRAHSRTDCGCGSN